MGKHILFEKVIRMLTRVKTDVSDLLYPVTCLVCGIRFGKDIFLCDVCLENAFEPAGVDHSETLCGEVLPDWLRLQYVVWRYDKGGHIQDVLHHIKYGGLSDVGIVLGRRLGYEIINHPIMPVTNSTLLLPVPLHPARRRKRGYNQAEQIAKGVAEITKAAIIDQKAVARLRNTSTQTAYNAEKRKKNMSGVFQVCDIKAVTGKEILIIDDVITTGATSLELSGILRPYAASIGIAAVAKA